MASFTPGPWKVETHHRQGYDRMVTCWYVQAENKVGIAAQPAYSDDTNAEANARLIAAAPALYEALIAARAIIVEDANACRAFRHESEGPSGPENVLAKIDAVLAQARGNSI